MNIHTSNEMFVVIGADLNVKYMNEAGRKAFGITGDQLSGIPVTNLLPGIEKDIGMNRESQAEFILSNHGREKRMRISIFPYEEDFVLVIKNTTSGDTVKGLVEQTKGGQQIMDEVTQRLLLSKEPKELLDHLFDQLADLLGLDIYFNYLADPKAQKISLINYKGIGHSEAKQWKQLEYGEAVCGYVAQLKERVVANHIPASSDPKLQRIKELGIQCYVCHPLIAGEEVLGTLSFGSKSREAFAQAEIYLIEKICEQVGHVLERMLIMEELQHKNRSLEKAIKEKEALFKLSLSLNKKFREIFHTSKDAMLLVCCANRGKPFFYEVNAAVVQLLGYTADELKKMPPKAIIAPEYQQIIDHVAQTIEQEKKMTVEVSWVKKDGEKIPVDLSISCHYFQERTYYLIIARDLTERKAFEQALIEEKIASERANLAKSKFLSMMSHEMRTPLNSILGYAQMIELKAQGTIHKHTGKIKNATIHLTNLINDILDYVGLEEGNSKVAKEPVNLVTIIQDSINMVMASAEINGVFITSNIHPASSLFVEGDPLRLKQVVMNLLSNAIKYGGTSGLVTVLYKEMKDKARIEVRDNGPGIHDHDLERIFEPFYRSDEVLNLTEGRGLGLSLVKEFVTQMNGQYGVESEKNKGTLFWIELPKANVTTEAPLAPFLKEKDKKNFKVLYIEDNEENRHLLKEQFKVFFNIELVTAADGLSGLKLVQEQRFDLVLLDINLPLMDGLQVCKKIRCLPEYQEVPIIAISAHALKKDIQYALESGFDDYLVKPVDIRSLKALIDQYIQKTATPALP